MADDATRRLLENYPRIFLACHERHRRDPESKNVLSDAQAGLLDHLDPLEATRLTDLARHMGVTPSSASLAVARLVRRGYVVRSRSPGDRREVRLRLSAEGARVREAGEVLSPRLARRLLGRLGPEERRWALAGLALLARAANDLLRERSESGVWSRRSERSS